MAVAFVVGAGFDASLWVVLCHIGAEPLRHVDEVGDKGVAPVDNSEILEVAECG
ncbi:hypothetical protein [Corynebacterium coyleae]|uniref:hypothetical protein n=1 Tax=Corynebacterium coyleae TaxID=53374 RepID=UPI00254CAD23|nr:hypothetical protein [Corynebacterium coyleae]MDK8800411.1 hypothetical protein [Corynebacterium coyleae]